MAGGTITCVLQEDENVKIRGRAAKIQDAKILGIGEFEGIGSYSDIDILKMYNKQEGNETIEYLSDDQIETLLNDKQGIWLHSDRISATDRWKKAMKFITCKEKQGIHYLKGTVCVRRSGKNDEAQEATWSFELVRDYYHWIICRMDEIQSESMWAKGAAYLVDELADTYELEGTSFAPGVLTEPIMKNLGQLLKDLNLGIAAYAMYQFNDMLHGAKTRLIRNWNGDWYDWDSQFITEEQITVVAFKVYNDWHTRSPKTLAWMNAISRKEGLTGNGNQFMGWLAPGTNHFIPDFSLWDHTDFKVDLTNPSTQFGARGRYEIPMYMLYPILHQSRKSNSPDPDKVRHAQLNSDQLTEILLANKNIKAYYNTKVRGKF